MSVTFSKPLIYGNIILFGGAILFAVIFGIYQFANERERASYKNNIPIYLDKPQNPLLNKYDAPKDSVVISGKLIPVNLNSNAIDPVFSDLPKALKPETPEQVKTVVWIRCQPKPSSLEYTDGTKGISNECELIFIDFLNKKFLWRDTVSVSPPNAKKRGDEIPTPDPGENILRYLEQIARRE